MTPTTTKGDLLVDDGTNAIRIAIGANNTVLTSDSTQTVGLRWADPTILSIVTITSTYTVLSTDNVIFYNATYGAFTLTLPSSVSVGAGKTFIFKNISISTNIVTLSTTGSDTIENESTQPLFTPNMGFEIISDGVSTFYFI